MSVGPAFSDRRIADQNCSNALRNSQLEFRFVVLTMKKPNVTKTTHILPFGELSPLQFERLCLWLVEREGYMHAEHLGEAGSEQGRATTSHAPRMRVPAINDKDLQSLKATKDGKGARGLGANRMPARQRKRFVVKLL